MLELIDLLRDWLSGEIQCQIEDVNAGDDDYILYRGSVNDAFRYFKDLAEQDDSITYELYSYMEIDPATGLLYIPVQEI